PRHPPLSQMPVGGWCSVYSLFLANHCVCSLENAFSQFIIYSDKSSSVSILFFSDLIKIISCAVKEYEDDNSLCFFDCNQVNTDDAATAITSIGSFALGS